MIPAVGSMPRPSRRRGERLVHQVEDAAVAQHIEVVLDRRERREVLRQHRPLAPRRRHVLDRVPDGAQIGRARSSDLAPRRHEGRNHRPLRVRAVACVAQAFAGIVSASDFSPGHGILQGVATQENHNRLKSLNIVFGRALREMPSRRSCEACANGSARAASRADARAHGCRCAGAA